MESYIIKPVHLLATELDYELRIRGIVTTRKDVAAKRKMLARALDTDKNRALELVDPDNNFDNENFVIDDTLTQITSLVSDFEGSQSDSYFKRITSRLGYLSRRIKHIVVPAGDNAAAVLEYRNEAYASCPELDAILNEKAQ